MSTLAGRETVASFGVEVLRTDPQVVAVNYLGSRGTRRRSECKWNTEAAARRHGAALLGRPMSR